MTRGDSILLQIWREACRHIEIEESIHTIWPLLDMHLSLAQLVIYRFEMALRCLVPIAEAPQTMTPMEQRVTLPDEELKRLQSWSKKGSQIIKRSTVFFAQLAGLQTVGQVVVVPLGSAAQITGVLAIRSKVNKHFQPEDVELMDRLREPLSVALENHRRLHEITQLREAAEADKGALLRRLGRTDLGDTIIGETSGLKPVMERVGLVTNSDVPVLILGETGTGKELIARALHVRGPRHRGPFIRINCGAIPPELVDSQLFGHEKGSFTGADQTRQGWFERADGGTLFLDEIGELPLEAQVRFLRVLQDGFIERVGGSDPIHVNVRIVAATHRDLPSMIREGRFREDLWYRLAVYPVLLPPLRDRRQDISELAVHFAERAAAKFTLMPVAPSQRDIELLQSYDWPGNIRELGAVIDRAAILGNGRRLEIAKSLGTIPPPELSPQKQTGQPHLRSPEVPKPISYNEVASLNQAIRTHIETALSLTEGRVEGRRGAAALLETNPHTLRAKMRKLGIDWTRFRPE